MARTPEGEPTHSRIYRNGENGVLQQTNFGGVAIESKLDGTGSQYIPRPKAEIQRILEEQAKQSQKPTGGVKGAIFNGIEYVPIE